MGDDAIQLREQLIRLAPEDRAALAHFLWESLDDNSSFETQLVDDEADYDDALRAELARREAEFIADPSKARPASEIMAELREEFP